MNLLFHKIVHIEPGGNMCGRNLSPGGAGGDMELLNGKGTALLIITFPWKDNHTPMIDLLTTKMRTAIKYRRMCC
jgi:hypothetical protein